MWNYKYVGNITVYGSCLVQLTGRLLYNESNLLFDARRIITAIKYLNDCIVSNPEIRLDLKEIDLLYINEIVELMT